MNIDTRNSGPKSLDQDQEPKPWNLNWITRTKNADPGPEICDQSLGFILNTVWTFLATVIFVIRKYLLKTNIDISINVFI